MKISGTVKCELVCIMGEYECYCLLGCDTVQCGRYTIASEEPAAFIFRVQDVHGH